jgi:hypothetical protein
MVNGARCKVQPRAATRLFLQRAALSMFPKEIAQKEEMSKALGAARESVKQAARKIADRGQLVKTAK